MRGAEPAPAADGEKICSPEEAAAPDAAVVIVGDDVGTVGTAAGVRLFETKSIPVIPSAYRLATAYNGAIKFGWEKDDCTKVLTPPR